MSPVLPVRSVRRCVLAALLVLVAIPAPAADAPAVPLAQRPAVAERLQVLDAWLATRVKERDLPSVSVGIVHDQELVFAKSYGWADVAKKVPATPDTTYRIASISKTFTATALLQLRDAGKLQLDDPVVKHLPWFTPKDAHPGSPVITIRHLITHTSGLPRESAASWYWNDFDFPTRDAMIAALAKQETVFPAETEYKYSNLALAIAGEVVTAASGEPYAAYVTKHILEPLGMKGTVVMPAQGMPGLAIGYGRRVPGKPRSIRPFTDLRGLAACGNLASSVSDLAKYVSFQMQDSATTANAVLKPSTLREMHRVQWLRPTWKSGMGLGFAVRRVDEEVRYGHGGAISGHKTAIEVAPETKMAVIVLTNEDDGRPTEIRDAIFKIVEPAIRKATEPSTSKAPDAAWNRFVGTYEWEDDQVQVMLLDNELAIVDATDDDPWADRIRLSPAGPNAFKMKGGGTEGELVVFELDEKGNVKRMTVADSYYLPR